jgi:hypothetical protein
LRLKSGYVFLVWGFPVGGGGILGRERPGHKCREILDRTKLGRTAGIDMLHAAPEFAAVELYAWSELKDKIP